MFDTFITEISRMMTIFTNTFDRLWYVIFTIYGTDNIMFIRFKYFCIKTTTDPIILFPIKYLNLIKEGS